MSKNTKWPKNIAKLQLKYQNAHEIHIKFPSHGLQKYPEIGIFGIRINHLATLGPFSSYFLLKAFVHLFHFLLPLNYVDKTGQSI
jgi:hypothetical protein